MASSELIAEIAATAAVLVVEEGLEYGPAKQQALKRLRLPARTPLPDNDALETAVREHIGWFCADTQAQELRVLRELALSWMTRLEIFQPHVGGAVWHGTATRLSDIFLQLFVDDPKTVEWWLLEQRLDYDTQTAHGPRGQPVLCLSVQSRSLPLQRWVGVHLFVQATEDFRGALLPDRQGRVPRGSVTALRACLAADF